jgi:phosphoserine aminotransferase
MEVLLETQEQLDNNGQSILEFPVGSGHAAHMIQDCKDLFRLLLNVPKNYTVILGGGGATAQFACVPFNLLDQENQTASYIVNGLWSELAFQECELMGKPFLANSFQQKPWTCAPHLDNTHLAPNSRYLYYCDNETVHGIEFTQPPSIYGAELVVDMTSNFLTRPVDISKYGLVYSGAQKNWGPPGLAVVIIRNDLLERPGLPNKPGAMDFKKMLQENWEGTNVPLFALTVAINNLKWIIRNGGLKTMDTDARKKAAMIYDLIDSSEDFYVNKIRRENRSRVNIVCFLRGNDEHLTTQFVKEAAQRGLLQVGGHKLLGGLRFSIYGGMPMDGVVRLRDFMVDFQQRYGNKPSL